MSSRLRSALDPDADEAQRWLRDELDKPVYQAAEPNWFDRLAGDIRDWFGSLDFGSADGDGLAPLIIVIVIVALLVAAVLIFGRPSLRRRHRAGDGSLFGAEEARTAAMLRRDAEAAAAAADWATATVEMFRALARSLDERTIVSVAPGTTAQDFARRAGGRFPDHADELAACAGDFDEVRYLQHLGTRAHYARVACVESAIRSSRASSVLLQSSGVSAPS